MDLCGKYVNPALMPYTFTRRQDTPVVYDINSNIYFYNTGWLKNGKPVSPISDNHYVYTMPDYASVDIDNIVDFEVAEFLHRKYYLNG
jgi:CMP-N,N'-diacetyllegionaminic acid synthase